MTDHEIKCNEIETFLCTSLKKLSEATEKHLPFCNSRSKYGYMKYIPERCFTTYFAYSLITNGFQVFNEQEYEGHELKKLDLLARKFSDNLDDRIQLKIEAKGNLDGCYKEIISDIQRMQKLTLRYAAPKGFKDNVHDDYFTHNFNIIITSNWNYSKLTKWWLNDADAPERTNGGFRKDPEWKTLKKIINGAHRGSIKIIGNIDALYAIFSN